MKNPLTAFMILCAVMVPAILNATVHEDPHTIILDPGHGGKDYGAVGKITNEKTINLNVAIEVRRLLKDSKDLNIIMTREDDRFIELQERAKIANRNHGDLFVSIHVNSVAKSNKNRKNIAGASVYTLGLHRTAANFEVAKRENSVIELENDYSTKYQGFDPNSTESYIMFELSQNKHLDQSIRFADLTVSQLASNAGRRNRGVRQAGFWVLHASAMPSVLIELDFICNPTSERFMNSKEGVKQIARSIANAVLQYFGHEKEVKVPKAQVSASSPLPESMPAPGIENTVTDNDTSANERLSIIRSDKVTYRIQILACSKSLPKDSKEFKGFSNIHEYKQGGMYKYTVDGDFETENEAENYAAKNIRAKFPNAFIIMWKNGQRI